MKKIAITTAAAIALLATPFANASAADYQPVNKNVKVYYKTINLSDRYDWCKVIFKNDDAKWNKEYKWVPQSNVNKQPSQNVATPPQEVQKPAPAPVQPAPQAPQAPAEEQKPAGETQSQLSAFEQQVVDLTNAERAKNGLAPLQADTELSKVAREKSRDMSVNKYFDHNSPTYGSPFDMMKQFGISYRSAGENIAYGQRTPQEVVNAWMNSSGHRANILSKNFTHIGVGHVENGNYWTQMFIGK